MEDSENAVATSPPKPFAGKGTKKFGEIDSADFMKLEFPLPTWHVPNMLPEASLTIFAGAPGSYKTFLALKIACRLAEGKRMFDMIEVADSPFESSCAPANVLFVEEEMNRALVQHRLKKLRFSGDALPAKLFFAFSTGLKLNRESDLDGLRALVLKHGIKCVFLDPFSSIHGVREENDNAGMAAVLDGIRRRLVDDPEVRCSVVIIHHPAKNATGSPTSVRGAGDIMGKADFVLAFEKVHGEPATKVQCIKNRLAMLDEIPVYTIEFRSGPENIEVALSDMDSDKRSEKTKAKDEMADKIEAAFSFMGGEVSRKEITDYLGVERTDGSFTRAWKVLKDSGALLLNEETKKFRLAPIKTTVVQQVDMSQFEDKRQLVEAPPIDGNPSSDIPF